MPISKDRTTVHATKPSVVAAQTAVTFSSQAPRSLPHRPSDQLWGPPSLRRSKSAPSTGKQPNILVIWGDDVGWENVSAYGMGVMGYKTPNIDRIGLEGIRFDAGRPSDHSCPWR